MYILAALFEGIVFAQDVSLLWQVTALSTMVVGGGVLYGLVIIGTGAIRLQK